MDTPTIAATRRFLSLFQEGRPPSDRELARALDELAMAYHQAPEGDPAEGGATPPREEYQDRYARLGKRFPDYGYYAVADPSEPLNRQTIVGDAIDDLTDIAGDLERVVWRFENHGPTMRTGISGSTLKRTGEGISESYRNICTVRFGIGRYRSADRNRSKADLGRA